MPLATPILASLRAPDGATRDKPCEYVSLTMSRYFCLPGPVPSRRLHLGPPPVGSATRTRPHCDTTTLFTVIHNHCKVVSFSCPRELGAKCAALWNVVCFFMAWRHITGPVSVPAAQRYAAFSGYQYYIKLPWYQSCNSSELGRKFKMFYFSYNNVMIMTISVFSWQFLGVKKLYKYMQNIFFGQA